MAEGHVDVLHALIEANRDFLRPWMPWAGGQDLEGTRSFVRSAEAQLAAGNGFHAAIVEEPGGIVGVIGFDPIDWDHRSTSLGYWLGRHAQGKGIMTLGVRAAVSHAFDEWGLNRIEICVAPGNVRSRALVERLGFVQEGVLRQAERHDDGFRDLVVYAMLAEDWRGGRDLTY